MYHNVSYSQLDDTRWLYSQAIRWLYVNGGIPQNGFVENLIRMGDSGVLPFQQTPLVGGCCWLNRIFNMWVSLMGSFLFAGPPSTANFTPTKRGSALYCIINQQCICCENKRIHISTSKDGSGDWTNAEDPGLCSNCSRLILNLHSYCYMKWIWNMPHLTHSPELWIPPA